MKAKPDPYQRYEETKYRQFKASCKLEGIELPDAPDPRELSAILDDYRQSDKRGKPLSVYSNRPQEAL